MEESQIQAAPAEIGEIATQAASTLDAAAPLEMACALGLPILALLIGALVNRWMARRTNVTVGARILGSIAPLLGPMLAVLFTAAAQVVLRNRGMELELLPFVTKLAAAWLAIYLVLTLSSRNVAGWFIVLIIIPVTTLHLLGLWLTVAESLAAVQFRIATFELNLYLILKTAAMLVILFWATGAITHITEKRIKRISRIHISNRMLIMKIFQIVLYFVVFILGLQIVGIDLTALSVFGGALGVGIGFGLQKIASNFISGIILLFEKSAEIGDLIQLQDGTTGFIRHTGARYTLLELMDGREALIPNEDFITQRIFSYTYSGKRGRIEIILNVDYDADAELASRLMVDAAKAHKRCITAPAPMCVLSEFGLEGIRITLFFWVGDIDQGTFITRSEVMMAILASFRANGIAFAAPRQVQLQPKEAKA